MNESEQGGAARASSEETRELHKKIEQNREELGDTVEALAAKADVKARVQDAAERAKTGAGEGLAQAKATAGRLGDQAGKAVRNPENAGRVKAGGAAVAGSAALAVAVWAIRRRRNRPKTAWEKTAYNTRQAWEQARAYGDAALHSDQTAQAVALSKRAARKAAAQARQAGAVARERAQTYGEAVANSDQVAQARQSGRRAARKAARKGREVTPARGRRRTPPVPVVLAGMATGLAAYRYKNREKPAG